MFTHLVNSEMAPALFQWHVQTSIGYIAIKVNPNVHGAKVMDLQREDWLQCFVLSISQHAKLSMSSCQNTFLHYCYMAVDSYL